MPAVTYSVVDAFTATPFKGNSAAVVILDRNSPLPDDTLQLIAAEFNLAETAFITPIDTKRGRFGLRWFTPTVEFPLCGHATLASAFVLFSTGAFLPKNVMLLEFETLSGVLTARSLSDGRIELEFPAGEATPVEDSLRKNVGELVQLALQFAQKPDLRFIGVGEGVSFGKYVFIHLDGIDLANDTIHPGAFSALLPQYQVIILTQRSHNASETFTSRVFCPAEAVPEDPVTGSAHCMLGPYWAKELQIAEGIEMVGKQVSARSGVVGVVWDREKGTCKLRGNATLMAKGELYLPS